MITVEDKLDIFYKLVYKDEEEKCIRELEELESNNNAILTEKKNELENRKKIFVERKAYFANIEKNELISKSSEDLVVKSLAKKEELLQDLIKSLDEKTKDFVQSKNYEIYIFNKISKVIEKINDNEIIITLNEGDNLRLQNLINELGSKFNKVITIDTSKSDIIGGFMLQDSSRTYNLDYSFKTIIEENKYLIGKTLYTSLQKVGATNE